MHFKKEFLYGVKADMKARIKAVEAPSRERPDHDPHPQVSAERKRGANWRRLQGEMYVAEKLVMGQKINLSRFKSGEVEKYRDNHFEQALGELVSLTEASVRQEKAYQRSSIILQSYYGQDKIYDFTMDLMDAWGQELPEEEPMLYARELYHNSLINIRRQFQRMQEKLREADSHSEEQPRKTALERRLTALERCRFSDADLNGFARAVRETKRLHSQMKADLAGGDIPPNTVEYQKFTQSAEKLSALFLDEKKKLTKEKLESFTESIQEAIQGEKQRMERMQSDIDRAKGLYISLCDALAREEMVLLMDSLNPEAGELEGKTTAEIHEQYGPLIEGLKAIADEYKK